MQKNNIIRGKTQGRSSGAGRDESAPTAAALPVGDTPGNLLINSISAYGLHQDVEGVKSSEYSNARGEFTTLS